MKVLNNQRGNVKGIITGLVILGIAWGLIVMGSKLNLDSLLKKPAAPVEVEEAK